MKFSGFPQQSAHCDNNTRKKTTPGCQSNFLCPNIFPSTVTSSSLSRHVHFRLIRNKWLLHALWCNTISCISHDIIYCTSLFNGKMSLRIFRAAGDGKITEGVKHTLHVRFLPPCFPNYCKTFDFAITLHTFPIILSLIQLNVL